MTRKSAEHPGQDEEAQRPEAHRAQGVDLLRDLHRAELGGERGAGAAADDDRRHQRPELARDREADQVGDVDVRAELLELDRRLEGHHEADEEVDEHHDRHGVGARAVHEGRDLAPVPRARPPDDAAEREDHAPRGRRGRAAPPASASNVACPIWARVRDRLRGRPRVRLGLALVELEDLLDGAAPADELAADPLLLQIPLGLDQERHRAAVDGRRRRRDRSGPRRAA